APAPGTTGGTHGFFEPPAAGPTFRAPAALSRGILFGRNFNHYRGNFGHRKVPAALREKNSAATVRKKRVMKTLREILLEKHGVAEPKLDLVRKKALSTLGSGALAAKGDEDTNWLGWLLSLRWHLAGLTAAWIVVGWLNAEKKAPAQNTHSMARNESPRYVLL